MKEENKETNLPAIVDKKVEETYAWITAKLKTIKEEESSTKTTGKISIDGFEIDLNSCQDLSTLIQFAAYLQSAEEAYSKAAQDLGLTQYPPLKPSGYLIKDILHDVKVRANVVTSHTQKSKLEKAKKELETLFSEEQKRKNVLDTIAKEFGIKEE